MIGQPEPKPAQALGLEEQSSRDPRQWHAARGEPLDVQVKLAPPANRFHARADVQVKPDSPP
jgi:hypothetical protein